MAPNALEILIHYFISSAPHPRLNAPVVEEVVQHFIKEGIFESNPDTPVKVNYPSQEGYFKLTEKGRAWMIMILQTPYPKQVWVNQKDKIICDEEGFVYI